jgi:IS5 family transposase
MHQPGIFDLESRLAKIDDNGDPLLRLNALIDWELFRADLESLRQRERKSNAGAKGYDPLLMFKVLILQSLYNLSDAQTENQILDRLSFARFLGLKLGGKVPDEKTIWLFRETLGKAGLAEKLFARFDRFLNEHGFEARKGQIIDATIVSCPKQRNSRDENAAIKRGERIEEWSEAKRRQKDVDARWTKKNNRTFFGYKNHVQADVKHKLIRSYEVTDASVHDSQVFEELLDEDNSSRDVYADAAYRSRRSVSKLKENGWRPRLQRKGVRGRPLTDREKRGNRTRSRIRARIEHIFGVMGSRAGDLILRCIGAVRARSRVGLRNLAFNIDRYALLASGV